MAAEETKIENVEIDKTKTWAELEAEGWRIVSGPSTEWLKNNQ